MISPLQLENFYTEEIAVQGNPTYDAAARERKAGKIDCSVEHAQAKQDPNRYRVRLTVSVNPSSERPALDPYTIRVRIVGFFHFRGENPSQEIKERMIGLNGSSILYGIARGTIAEATGVGQFGKYLLPTVNFHDVLKGQQAQRRKRTKKIKS